MEFRINASCGSVESIENPSQHSDQPVETLAYNIVVESQGKGGVVADGIILVKVYPLRVEQACGE
jgi:hypothetical protein